MRVLFILMLALGAVIAAPRQTQRIVGGVPTTVNEYPEVASLLYASASTYRQACVGVILNNRSVMSAAHCTYGDASARWRFRVGSTNANSGGTVYNANRILTHNAFNFNTMDSDICIISTGSNIAPTNLVRPAVLPLATLVVPDYASLTAVGWGVTETGVVSTTLRRVLVNAINQQTCINSYDNVGMTITTNMLCSGVLDTAGYDQCQGDSGSPLFYSAEGRAVVGISSFGYGCGNPNFPGVNTFIVPFRSWLLTNA